MTLIIAYYRFILSPSLDIHSLSIINHAGCIAAGVGSAFSRVCLPVCLSVCLRSSRKTA